MIEWLRGASAGPEIALTDATLPIIIRRHPTAKRMILRLAPDGSEVRVTMPRWGATRDACAFARSRRDWLDAQLSGLAPTSCALKEGTLTYRGQLIDIAWDRNAPRKPELVGDTICLGGPSETRLARLQRWLEAQAAELMRGDLAHYCEQACVSRVPDLRLSRARRRWGSCSSSGIVRVNWRLVQAPDYVRRSVVAHEVAHLVHFDHSPAFHVLLARIYGPDLAQADAWLKREGRRLYSAFG